MIKRSIVSSEAVCDFVILLGCNINTSQRCVHVFDFEYTFSNALYNLIEHHGAHW